MRADNGREFIAEDLQALAERPGVQRRSSSRRPARQQNCYIERFNGSMRRELLNGELFHSVLEAKVVINEWLELYNTRRPHRGLGGKTPAAYAKMCPSHPDDDTDGGSR